MDDPALRAALVAAVGAAHVIDDPEITASWETDWTGRWSGRARFVVRPGDTAEVAGVVAACAAAGAPIVAQGGNTGLVGGGVPRGGEVLLSTRRLDALALVDGGAGGIVAGAGATLASVQRAAADAGFAFGVDITPRGSCTIGGMIATNAGGAQVVRHGMMAAQVVAIEAVGADGAVLGRVPAPRKDNAGYPLAALLAGSEGTLAIVTRAHLALVPTLDARAGALLGFADPAAATAAIPRLRRDLPSLLALEVLFAEALDLACAAAGGARPLRDDCAVALLVECAGRTSPREELTGALAGLGDLLGEAAIAEGGALARLRGIREGVPEAIRARGVPRKMDVSIPPGALAAFAGRARELVAALAPGAETILFGHAADGNLHVNVLGAGERADRVEDAVLDLAATLGGSIAAEHGIGVAKVAALARTRPAAELRAMRALKDALDPRGLLNPGVVLAAPAASRAPDCPRPDGTLDRGGLRPRRSRRRAR